MSDSTTFKKFDSLLGRLVELGYELDQAKLEKCFDDGCPGDPGAYPLARIESWLLQQRPQLCPAQTEGPTTKNDEPAADTTDVPHVPSATSVPSSDLVTTVDATAGQQLPAAPSPAGDEPARLTAEVCPICVVQMRITKTQPSYTHQECPACGRKRKVTRLSVQQLLAQQEQRHRHSDEPFAARPR